MLYLTAAYLGNKNRLKKSRLTTAMIHALFKRVKGIVSDIRPSSMCKSRAPATLGDPSTVAIDSIKVEPLCGTLWWGSVTLDVLACSLSE